MNDLDKQKVKRVNEVLDKVAGDFSEGYNRLQLDKLYERKALIEETITDSKKSAVTIANRKLQLESIEEAIIVLSNKIDISKNIDIEVDEVSAKEFIKDNPDIFEFDEQNLIEQNKFLDKLELDLFGKKK